MKEHLLKNKNNENKNEMTIKINNFEFEIMKN